MDEKNEIIYRKLQKHLDKLPVGFPATEDGSDIRVLKAFFTPEEARFATFLTFFPETPKQIWRRAKRKLDITLDDTKKKLKSMSDKGIIYHGVDKQTGELLYMNVPLAIGFFEFAINNLNKEKVEAIEGYMDTFIGEFASTGVPQIRTIPINAAVTRDTGVMPYDEVWTLLDQMKGPFAVATCVCTQEKAILGQKCKHELTERCLTNSKWYIEQGHAREITKEEAIELVKRAQEDGLVVQPGNYKKADWFCLCCGCCCGILSNAKKLEKPALILASNYYSEVVSDDCIACGTCVDYCPMDAIEIEEVAVVNRDRCIGCGVCISKCPSEAIKLRKKSQIIDPPKDRTDLYSQIMKRKVEIQKAEMKKG